MRVITISEKRGLGFEVESGEVYEMILREKKEGRNVLIIISKIKNIHFLCNSFKTLWAGI